MASGLWFPGMAAGPQDELVDRIHRQIERFARDAGIEQAFVEAELTDGSRLTLDAILAEPGFGFVTLVPHPEVDEELPEQVIVPVGSIRRIELARAEERRARFGFSLPTSSP
jgi:hypothetical protein